MLERLDAASSVAAYLALPGEVDPLPILSALAERGAITALPHITARDAAMRFLRWSPGDPLDDGPYGLRQPRADAAEVVPAIILAPLLGFDRGGRRIGLGAGFYDRAFAALPGARRIGLARADQEMPLIPTDPWDVPLEAIATEYEWITP